MARNSRQQLIDFEELDAATDLSPAEQATWQAARDATAHAYAPYSGFHVGAALLLADGTIFKGTNQENAAYPSGLCAERTALFGLAAAQPGHAPIVGMAVAARPGHGDFGPAMPCGACRQVMLEYESSQGQPIPLLLPSRGGTILRFSTLSALMPFCFSADDLPPAG
jgi:cytidine deaminase